MLLARKGYKVLLVDRAGFPSDIPHGHLIHRGGPRLLKRWGLLDKLVATGCPEVARATSNYGDFNMTADNLVMNGVAWGYGPRRAILDQLLVDAAIEAGVEFRPHFSVRGLEMEAGNVKGIRGRNRKTGREAVEHAQITIGADGRNSTVARAVGATPYFNFPSLTCTYFSYWSGVEHSGFEMYVPEGNAIFSFPTHNGLLAIFIAWPVERFREVRSNLDEHFCEVLDRVPEFAGRVRAGRREERFYGSSDLPNFFRKPYGSGWALVGDAGYHKDPFLALGVADAFRDAELLADAIDDGLSGQSHLDTALARYESERNGAGNEEYAENLQFARLKGAKTDFLRLRAALRGKQDAINRFFMARMGMIPKEAFFNPANLGRLLGSAPNTTRAVGSGCLEPPGKSIRSCFL
jgi:2-polyprenyl-6-methoxyphenol hydroxylase-like FAD-dependent oxidoreductase